MLKEEILSALLLALLLLSVLNIKHQRLGYIENMEMTEQSSLQDRIAFQVEGRERIVILIFRKINTFRGTLFVYLHNSNRLLRSKNLPRRRSDTTSGLH